MTATWQLIPLGVNGFFPSYGRHTMCFLLLSGSERALLLDAGSGLSRLAEAEIARRLESVATLDILLSHYHLDHTVGLTYLIGAWGKPARIHAPAPPLLDAGPEVALERLIAPPLFPLPLAEFPVPIEIVPYDGDFELLGLSVRCRRQHHPGGSVGLRLGDLLAYVTDTVSDEDTADFAAGAELLMHEVWATDEEAADRPFLVKGHSAVGPVLDLAERAGVKRLMPVHHHPLLTGDELEHFLSELAARSLVEVVTPREGTPVPLR